MHITLDPHGPDHACAAEYADDFLAHRRAWISREGVVYVATNSLEAADDWAGLTEFARMAEAALREAVAK